MGRGKLRVVVIGLPLFAKRVAKELASFDRKNSYTALDTYYKKADKAKYYLKVRNADIIYSINGTLTKSGAIDLALKLNKKVILHWVGTDVTKAIEAYNQDNYVKEYIDGCTHWCEVDWIKEELKEIDINADIVNFASFEVKAPPLPFQSEFEVLSYIPQNRSEFYGLNEIKKLAKDFPNIVFNIMGSKYEFDDIPNLHFLGWVKNGPEIVEKSTVCIRFTEHDGLSNFVLEALAKGKYVLYNNSFQGVYYCPDYNALNKRVKMLHEQFLKSELPVNLTGHEHIKAEFNRDYILNGLIERFDSLVNEQ